MNATCSSSAPQRRALAWSLNGMCGWLATSGASPVRARLVRNTAFLAGTLDAGCTCCTCWGLTFDMRGGRQLAKPDVARPLDGRVSPQLVACTAEKGRLAYGTHGCSGLCTRSRAYCPTRDALAFVFRCIARHFRVTLLRRQCDTAHSIFSRE